MSWTYKVSSHSFYHNGTFQFTALYAGKPGFKNDPAFECVKDKGPLPRGKYTISEPFYHHRTRAWTLRLTPDTSNNMCGRDGFLIHGGSSAHPGGASNGCIIATLPQRKAITASHDHILIVE
ncbi:DUF2778 domain-containing protein [Enterobacteriaceae bacterium H11S18]|uniref:tlde1 domain-containing protein n=1 Tax=Dryocola clanedunensis TaxID=2925396 RepID=UPI0022F050BD|nr:tlde1 domain-containing protein [Dryocola clanedunensis]MCT4711319.1 DUF2778 domain-containing protein [Dryocola clanedunensis]